jgi:hypothetical protein
MSEVLPPLRRSLDSAPKQGFLAMNEAFTLEAESR